MQNLQMRLHNQNNKDKSMSGNVIAPENIGGPFQVSFRRVMRMVPDKDKTDTNLQRLIAFRLRTDGEAATSEYLMRKIKELLECAYSGRFYDFIKDDLILNECSKGAPEDAPGAA